MTRNHHSRPLELQNNAQGFRYRLGLTVAAWCMGTLTLLMFWPGKDSKLDVLNTVVTPQSTLLGAVVLGLLGIKGYQDWSRSSWGRNRDYDNSRRSEDDGDDKDSHEDNPGGRGE